MKKILLTLVFCCFYINNAAQSVFVTEKEPVVTETIDVETIDIEEIDEEKSRKIRLWVPAFTFKVASWFVDKEGNNEEKQLLKSVGNVSLFLLTNTSATDDRAKRYQKKFNRKVKRKGGEELIVVKTSEANINIKAVFNKKGKMKKTIVLVDAEDVLLFAKVNGLPNIEYLNKLINE